MSSEQQKTPFSDFFKHAIEQRLRGLMICLPGKVVSFDPGSQMAQVECGIQRRINGQFRTIPIISNVRVQFTGDGEWYFWHQIKPGTEGLIHFSQRAIDTWNDQGGPVAPHELRIFSVEDAFFVPGIRSSRGLIPNFDNSGVGMSSYDGSTRIHLSPGKISMKASVVDIDADTLNIKADTATTGKLTNNGKDVGSGHKHKDTQPGNGTSGEPV